MSANGRIAERFHWLQGRNEAAFVPFLMAGDGGLETTERLLDVVVAAGADVIELGVPFSDPNADGPALQRAAERALTAGATLTGILDLVARFRRRSNVPLVLFGYSNPFLRFGAEELAEASAAVGVDAILSVDMPPEEAEVLRRPLRRRDLDMIFLLAPTSTPERIRRVLGVAGGFVYFVSVAGVTGVKQADAGGIREMVTRIRGQTRLPVGIGFGITRPEQASAVSGIADAVVVGSEIARQIEAANGLEERMGRVGQLARALKAATRRVRAEP